MGSKPANSEQHYPEADKRQVKKLPAETVQGTVKVNVTGELRGTLPPYRRKERGEGKRMRIRFFGSRILRLSESHLWLDNR